MASRPELNRLLADTRKLLRVRNYTERTRDTYVRWVQRFLTANSNTPVERLTRDDVEEFLAVLTTEHRLAPKSRNQATTALAFFFRDVLGRDEWVRCRAPRSPPEFLSVLSHRQVRLVLGQLSGKYRLLGSLMYGSGLRLTEAHQLRVKDVDFDHLQITVRDGKGAKDRWVMLPERLVTAMTRQLALVEEQHEGDRTRGAGWAVLP